MDIIICFFAFVIVSWIVIEELTNPKILPSFRAYIPDKLQYLDLLVKYGGILKGRELRVAMMEEKKGRIRVKDFWTDILYLKKEGFIKIFPPFNQLDIPLSQTDILLCTIQIDPETEKAIKHDEELLKEFSTNTNDEDFKPED